MNIKDVCLAVLIALIWGLNYVAMKLTAIEMPGFLSAAVRFILTAIILLPFATRPKISFNKLYYISVISGAYIGLIYYSLYLGINTCLGIILMQLNAPFTILIARISLKEEFTLESLIGMGIALIGVITVVGAPSAVGDGFAVFVMLGAAFCCAIFSVKSKESNKVSPLNLIFWTHLIAAPHLFLVSNILDGNSLNYFDNLSNQFWFYLMYSILLSCIFGIAIRIYLLRKYPVHKVVSFNLLIPFFGVISSMIFEKNIPSWHIFVGGAIIMVGIGITQSKFWKFGKQIYENN